MEQNFKPMLLLTINNSIGDKINHFSIKSLITLFSKNSSDYTLLDKYAIEIIQTEATKEELDFFIKKYNIEISQKEYILNYVYK